MFCLAYKKSIIPLIPTKGFTLSNSSFSDVNGIYKNVIIPNINEYDFDNIYNYLVNTNQLSSSIKSECGTLLGIYSNGKTYIITGTDKTMIVPLSGNTIDNWYYVGEINENETFIWSYNISPGITSDSQSSQDWTQHEFPSVIDNDNTDNILASNDLMDVYNKLTPEELQKLNDMYEQLDADYYVKRAKFIYREKRWMETGDPVEMTGEDGMTPVYEAYSYNWAKYTDGLFSGWTYSNPWPHDKISIMNNESILNINNIDFNSSSKIVAFNDGNASASFITKEPKLKIVKSGNIGRGVFGNDYKENLHVDDVDENPNMYNCYAAIYVYISPKNMVYQDDTLDKLIKLLEYYYDIIEMQADIYAPDGVYPCDMNTMKQELSILTNVFLMSLWKNSKDIIYYGIKSLINKLKF